MHIEPMYSLAIKRVLFFVSVVALAVIAVSCDRESPLQATGDRPTFAGTGGTTGGSVTFSARATGAKSGTSDMFRIRLSNGYQANGTLQGGNIQLHTPCR